MGVEMPKRTRQLVVWLCVFALIAWHMVFGLMSTKALWANWLPVQLLWIFMSAFILQALVMLLFVKWCMPKSTLPERVAQSSKEEQELTGTRAKITKEGVA